MQKLSKLDFTEITNLRSKLTGFQVSEIAYEAKQ